MTLTGKAARDFMEQVSSGARKRHAEQLAAAKAEAAARGKEPFDLARLETLCDTSGGGRGASLEERQAEFEQKYYVHFPNVMTIAEFAEKVNELSRW